MVLEAVRHDGETPKNAAPEHKADQREIVLETMKQADISAPRHAAPEHEDDHEIMFEAVLQKDTSSDE